MQESEVHLLFGKAMQRIEALEAEVAALKSGQVRQMKFTELAPLLGLKSAQSVKNRCDKRKLTYLPGKPLIAPSATVRALLYE
jgi:hypothetical protein